MMSNRVLECDILIVGGGLSGASLALALKNTGLQIIVVEAMPASNLQSNQFDSRSLALSKASQTIFESLDVWTELENFSTPITNIHVSKNKTFGRTFLKSEDFDLDAFGYVCELSQINQVLQKRLQTLDNFQHLCPARLKNIVLDQAKGVTTTVEVNAELINVQPKIVVAADGTRSFIREQLKLCTQKTEYNQTAIVANIGLRRAHQGIAYERFTDDGLIAMLPMSQQRASLVWACEPEHAEKLLSLSEQAFLKTLQENFGYRLGALEKLGKRSSFPLSLEVMSHVSHQQVIFVGNASQTLHPVAGQGFNLGLRDVAMLADSVLAFPLDDWQAICKRYQSTREADRNRMIFSTDQLVKWFGVSGLVFRKLQSVALLAADIIPPIKSSLAYHAMGFSNINSRLASQIPLAANTAIKESKL